MAGVRRVVWTVGVLGLVGSSAAVAEDGLRADLTRRIDAAVEQALQTTGAPSASIAIVREGRVVYAHAYGTARLEPTRAATPQMRYAVGSISKQFTAAAVLWLAQEGKLSLDDRVGKWFPDLTRASDITLRQILSMTSGYQDYWPEDYVMPPMLEPVRPQAILDGWAKKPLDFEPGTRWQYSNTNYVIAGLIVEKVSGTPLFDLLRTHIFEPLGMRSAVDIDAGPLGDDDAGRYLRYGLAPARPAPKEGRGWLWAMGELAMTASDLAAWDISLMDQTILKQESYRQMETEVPLANGVGTGYGLGLALSIANGRRLLSHTGEVSGFTARNDVYPDDRTAVVVLTNLDATDASSQVASKVGALLFGAADPAGARALDRAERLFEMLQQGRVDRAWLTPYANAYFSDNALHDFAASLGPLGPVQDIRPCSQSLRGGMTYRAYHIALRTKTLRISTFVMPDGRFEQFVVTPGD